MDTGILTQTDRHTHTHTINIKTDPNTFASKAGISGADELGIVVR